VSFVLVMAALVVCGCIFTRKPRKKLPMETLQLAVPDEHQPGCFALEEDRGVLRRPTPPMPNYNANLGSSLAQ
jgi:hypothetical protein